MNWRLSTTEKLNDFSCLGNTLSISTQRCQEQLGREGKKESIPLYSVAADKSTFIPWIWLVWDWPIKRKFNGITFPGKKLNFSNHRIRESFVSTVNKGDGDVTVSIAITCTDVMSQHCMQLREKEGSVKIWELDSNNRNSDRDSSDESNIDESSDPLRLTGMLSMYSWPRMVAPPRFRLLVFFTQPLELVFWRSYSSTPFCRTSRL